MTRLVLMLHLVLAVLGHLAPFSVANSTALAASTQLAPFSVVRLVAGATTCPLTKPSPIIPTLEVRGDSLMQGGTCAGNTTTPRIYLNNNLPAAWVVAMQAKTGDSAAAISTAYFSGPTTGVGVVLNESAGCLGKRCKALVIDGCTNSLRVGVTPQACFDTMWPIVLDALGKGRAVVVVNVPPYGAWVSAGTNPQGQATGYNGILKTACDSIVNDPDHIYADKLRCVDAYTPFEDPDPADAGKMKPECTCDGVHFNETCSAQYMALIYAALLQVI